MVEITSEEQNKVKGMERTEDSLRPLGQYQTHQHSNYRVPRRRTLAWKIPWTEEPGRLQSMGSLRVRQTERLHFHFSLSCIGEGNGNPLQRSCLENPRDGGAWWAAVYGVAQSQTWLKWLSSSSSRRRKKKGFEKFFEEIIVEIFPNMEKEIAKRHKESHTG